MTPTQKAILVGVALLVCVLVGMSTRGPSLDQQVIARILESNPGHVDKLVNGCTIQLWSGGSFDNDPILMSDIVDDGGSPYRDGPRGLVRGITAEMNPANIKNRSTKPTVFYVGDRHTDGIIRLSPANDRNTYISGHTCNGRCDFNPFRAVVNSQHDNRGAPSEIWTKYRTRFSRLHQDDRRAGSIVFECVDRPGFKIKGAGGDTSFAVSTGWADDAESYFRVRFVTLGPEIRRVYEMATAQAQAASA